DSQLLICALATMGEEVSAESAQVATTLSGRAYEDAVSNLASLNLVTLGGPERFSASILLHPLAVTFFKGHTVNLPAVARTRLERGLRAIQELQREEPSIASAAKRFQGWTPAALAVKYGRARKFEQADYWWEIATNREPQNAAIFERRAYYEG